jgi:hypothetical protein
VIIPILHANLSICTYGKVLLRKKEKDYFTSKYSFYKSWVSRIKLKLIYTTARAGREVG